MRMHFCRLHDGLILSILNKQAWERVSDNAHILRIDLNCHLLFYAFNYDFFGKKSQINKICDGIHTLVAIKISRNKKVFG